MLVPISCQFPDHDWSEVDLHTFKTPDGIGPLLFAPLSEIPHIGRNPPYIVSFAVFVAISLVLGAVDNFPAIAVLRFFQGLFGSPCLATTGASIRDLYGDPMSSYGLFIWILGLFAGPALGPAFASHAVQENWRWPFWQISCMAIPCFVLMLVSLPETSANTLLLRRARRLGREMRSISRGEGETCRISLAQGLQQHDVQDYRQFWRYMGNSMIKPLEIMIKDPAIAFVTVYASFTYAIYYSFFEAFAIVYRETYQMGLVGFSLQFLAIVVGSVIGAAVYGIYLFRTIKSRQGDQPQEIELVPALPAVLFPPIGLYIFAFAARTDVHWIVPGCGIAVYAASLFLIYQAILIYIPLSYPYYAASMFAANDFARSLTATGFIMATPYMYENLGVRDGVVILASISILGIPGMLVLYRCGQRLRDRSKFTANTV